MIKYTEQEQERINQQMEYDKTHFIREGKTVYDWKEDFIKELIIDKTTYYQEVSTIRYKNEFVRYEYDIVKDWVKCKEHDLNNEKYLQQRAIINPKNYGIAKVVNNQIAIYRETMPIEEIELTCMELIIKATRKFKILDDCIEGQEEGRLASYILTCLNKEIQNYIDDWTGTERERIEGNEEKISPKLMMSYNVEVESEDNDSEDTYLDLLEGDSNLFQPFEDYEPTDTLKIILKTLQGDLTDEQVELMQILAYTDNDNSESARIVKELDIEKGKELRASDDAYRVAIIREKAKINKLVEKNIDLHKIERITKLRLEQGEIDSFLEMDIDEKQVIDYTVANINEYYIDNIIYEHLELEQRQYLIKNFIHNYNEDKLQDKKTIEICRSILNGLYIHIEELGKRIEDLNIVKIPTFTPTFKNGTPINHNATSYKYYVQKDKLEELTINNRKELEELKKKEKKDTYDELKIRHLEEFMELHIEGEEVIHAKQKRMYLLKQELLLKNTSRSDFINKFDMDCYYLGERKDISRERKTTYGKIDQSGMRFMQD